MTKYVLLKRKRMKLIRTTAMCSALLLCTIIGCQSAQQRRLEQKLDQIDCVVREEIKKDNFPGAVILVGQADEILYCKAFGFEVIEPNRESMSEDSIFDLASLTKPIATATSILILVDKKKIRLTNYASKYLPAFGRQGKHEVQIRHLLDHTSGLPAYTSADELREKFQSPCPDRVMERIYELKLLSEPGKKFRYSCLGYIVLAKIVEAVSGKSIDDFSRENIFERLGMDHTVFNPPDSWDRDIAATQILEEPSRGAASCGLLRGEVHDPLARLMGGVSGNAGLFSTVGDLSVYCRMHLNSGELDGVRILSPEKAALLTCEQSHGRAYGFDVNSGYSWVKGSHASKKAFCHTGYTGTSVVCDPEGRVYVIILTNRAHPRDAGTCRPVRTKIADIVFQTCK